MDYVILAAQYVILTAAYVTLFCGIHAMRLIAIWGIGNGVINLKRSFGITFGRKTIPDN